MVTSPTGIILASYISLVIQYDNSVETNTGQGDLILADLYTFNQSMPITSKELENITLDNLKNPKIGLEEIDVERFRRKIEGTLQMYESPLKENVTRRQAYIHYVHGFPITKVGDKVKASRIVIDLMLQIVYMSRQKMQEVERDKHFEQTNYPFRLAYTFRSCQRIRRTMIIAYKRHMSRADKDIGRQLILHHKMARLHLDFLYLFWYQVKVSGLLKERDPNSDSPIELGMNAFKLLEIKKNQG